MANKQNKRIGWLLAIIIIPVFIYQFIDVMELSKRPSPLSVNAQARKDAYIRGLIANSKLSLLSDTVLALKISADVYDKFVQKYSYEKLVELEKAYLKGDTSEIDKFRSIFNSCIAPYRKELFLPDQIFSCIQRSVAEGHDKKVATSYCNCYAEFLIKKYNYSFENRIPDSLLKSESVARSDCFKAAAVK